MVEEKINFKIVTPEKILYEQSVEMITFPGMEGEFSVMARHMHMVAMILPGIIIVENNTQKNHFLTKGGVLEISTNASLLTEEMTEIDEMTLDELNGLIDTFMLQSQQYKQDTDETSTESSLSNKYLKMSEELKKFISAK